MKRPTWPLANPHSRHISDLNVSSCGRRERQPRTALAHSEGEGNQITICNLKTAATKGAATHNGGERRRTPFLFTLTNSAGIASRLGKFPPRLSEWSKIRTMLTTWPGSIYVYTRRAPHWWPEGRARPPTSSNGAMMYVVRTWEPWMTSTMTAVSAGWRSQTMNSSLCNYSTCAAWTNTVNSLPPSK